MFNKSAMILLLLSKLLFIQLVIQCNIAYVVEDLLTDIPPYNADINGALNGELRKWHKITLGFVGPNTNETNNVQNPFTDLRLDVTFYQNVSDKVYTIPGYYACDGNSANTGADSGPIWLVHFTPDEIGTWVWEVRFVTGTNIALNNEDIIGESATYMDGAIGSFDVEPSNKTGRDHRGKGRLQYVGEHHLRFAETGEWFLKAGSDSPENFLAYEDFDNTLNITGNLKSWSPHKQDYNARVDPTWSGGKGTGIIGAINYLSFKGMNAFSFIPMNIDGDDKSVYPYISDNVNDRLRMDCSKLAQWEIVFEHADRMGMFLHFKTQEQENDQLLDNGELGNERKLYYRELIARFSHHLALNWNLGEESTNTDQQRKQFSDYIKFLDPYGHPIVSHSISTQKNETYGPLLKHPTFDGVSLNAEPKDVFHDSLEWVQRSANSGRKWIVSSDEQNPPAEGVAPDSADPTHDVIRKNVLWANIMAGGAGVEYYFGYGYPNSDMTCQDYRPRANMWDQNRYALDFFSRQFIPFWNMTNENGRVSGDDNWCLAETNDAIIVVYLKQGGSAFVDLKRTDKPDVSYLVGWFDPRNGGDLQLGTAKLLSAENEQSLGEPPSNPALDWVVLLRECDNCILSSNEEGGWSTSLIVGLGVAAIILISIAIYLGLRRISQGPGGRNNVIESLRRDSPASDNLVSHNSDLANVPDRSRSDAIGARSHTGQRATAPVTHLIAQVQRANAPETAAQNIRRATAPTPLESTNGPSFNDQVRLVQDENNINVQNVSSATSLTPTEPLVGPTYKDQVRLVQDDNNSDVVPTVRAVRVSDASDSECIGLPQGNIIGRADTM